MSADFNWWLLIVGVAAGVALTWLVMADTTRREREIDDEEAAAEASWIARTVDDPSIDADVAERVLSAHRRYLRFPPPDTLVDPAELDALEREHLASGDPEASDPEAAGRA